MAIEIVNFTRQIGLKKKVAVLAAKIIKLTRAQGKDLSLVLVGEQRMRSINHQWRKQDQVTDVLSFSWAEKKPKGVVSGEIFICPRQIARQAKATREDFQVELTRILVHGILHLLGYDHEQNKVEAELMLEKQEQLLKKLK